MLRRERSSFGQKSYSDIRAHGRHTLPRVISAQHTHKVKQLLLLRLASKRLVCGSSGTSSAPSHLRFHVGYFPPIPSAESNKVSDGLGGRTNKNGNARWVLLQSRTVVGRRKETGFASIFETNHKHTHRVSATVV